MLATLRRLLPFCAGAIALSASGLAQVSTDASKAMSQAAAAGARGDPAEALRWYRKAAEQGDAGAQYHLGFSYAKGQGVPQNHVQAMRWYRLAAEQGDSSAQYNLGVMYEKGLGATANIVEAYKWFSLAVAGGDSLAGFSREKARERMTGAELAEGEKLAAAWAPNASATAQPRATPVGPPAPAKVVSTGSGFFVTASGHVLTNAHVVEDCKQVSLVGGSRLTLLDIDLGSDLALLGSENQTATPLVLRQGRGVRLAESILVAGFPLAGLLSSGLNVTTGAVSALAGPDNDRRLIQITAPVQPGNSGGPLLDLSGNVVGVVVSKLDAVKVASVTGDIPQNVNFAISLGTLQAFLDSNDVEYQMRASSTPRSNTDVAKIARAATVQIDCRD